MDGTMTLRASIIIGVFLTLLSGESIAQTHGNPSVRSMQRRVGFVPKHKQKKQALEVQRASFEDLIPDGSADAEAISTLPHHEPVLENTEWIQDSIPPAIQYPLRVTARAEYLLWSTKGMELPSLVTRSPNGTAQSIAGVLGQAGTTTLFGDGEINDEMRSGGRFTLGLFMDPFEANGMEVTYLSLVEENDGYAGANITTPILARPFFNTFADAEDSRLIAFPGLVAGTLNVTSATEFHSLEVVKRRPSVFFLNGQGEYQFGYRYSELTDQLRISESTISLTGPTLDTAFQLFDQFKTENQFHGGQFGIRVVRPHSRNMTIELLGKVALGNTQTKAFISGQTITDPPDLDASTTNSGLLVQETNSGEFDDNSFSTIFDVGVWLRHHSNCGLTTSIGYSFLFWSDVLRAGDVIDTTVNPTQIPPGTLNGEARPALEFNTTDFWAQGLNFGIEYRF